MTRKFLFLVPLLDNEGQPFPASEWDWMTDELVVRFGGWSLDGRVEGAWRDDTGHVYRDASVRYSVAIEEAKVAELFGFLGDVKARFRQLALYVEEPKTEVTFL